ncbi:MAG: tetratricopeptide repeat protein [Acidobacteriota bacterium]
MTYSKCIFPAVCLFFNLAPAQSPTYFSAQTRSSTAVQGAVVRNCAHSQDSSFDNLRVEINSRQNNNRSQTSDVRWDGGFEFREVPSGVYEAQVVNVQGGVIKRTLLTVDSMSNHQELRLDIPCAEKPVAGSVSIRRLSHTPPKDAVKALRKAAEAQQKGNVAQWEKYLRQAATLDPDYFEARNNFGAFLVRHQRPAEALSEFRAAMELDPRASAVLTNVSACLLGLDQMTEAEEYARRALAIDPASAQAHYLIGVAMVKQNRLTTEAAEHLHDSGSVFPKALEVEAAIRERLRRQTSE